MDSVTENKRVGSDDSTKSSESRTTLKPYEVLALSESDLVAIARDIDKIEEYLAKPPLKSRVGMVFDVVAGWESTSDDGEKIRVAVKKPRSARAEIIEKDILNRQRRLIEIGEERFAPTYRLP